ncbi:FHA domain-containing protein [Thermomonas sp.]|uniref:FHA domain-containing protein n=1 Tax=Thermomonas sp. TaxID=1971895 RepID=UPI00262FB762|nr:FHA domain-containing protein [Thermomonas sp.]MCO5055888.1 FHA domain-containing protein [Thermomonas sp.]
MKHPFLRFCDDSRPDLALEAGVLAFGRDGAGQLAPIDAQSPWLLQLSNDRRGIWLTVAEPLRGVHVNGRPIQQLAMLRAGDCIHVAGRKLLLLAEVDSRPATEIAPPQDPAASVRLVLRGVGGRHHGRSISLDRPCRIGSAGDAELRIEGHGILPQHALVEVDNGQVLLHAQADTVQVNGRTVREAVLLGGDQLAFSPQHRFVLEAPPAPVPLPHRDARDLDAAPAPPPRGWASRVPWLLVAAALLAVGLSALLVFGPR